MCLYDFVLQLEVWTFCLPSPFSSTPFTPHLWQPPTCSFYLWAWFFKKDSTCKWDGTIFGFVSVISLSIMPSIHLCCRKWQDFILFCDWIICIYIVVVYLLRHLQLFATPWTVAYQAPLSCDFPSKNTGIGCHFFLQVWIVKLFIWSPKGNKTEGLLLKLKFQFSGHLMWRGDILEKTLLVGNIEGRRRRGWQRMTRLEIITDSVDMNLSKLWEVLENKGGWHAGIHGVTKSQTWLSNWTIAMNGPWGTMS